MSKDHMHYEHGVDTIGPYLKKYKKSMVNALKVAHPEWDKDDIGTIVEDVIRKKCINPDVTIDNNYTMERRNTQLLGVLDWILEKNPIIAGNGTFYRNQYEAINPIANMLKGFLDQRAAYKKQMFAVPDATSRKYKDLDLSQQNEKILANSYYGGSGMPSSAFYSEWSGAATTLSAQSVISTAEQMFEGMIADNYIYITTTELIEFFDAIIKNFDFSRYDVFIKDHDYSEVLDRYLGKILNLEEGDYEFLNAYLSNLDPEALNVLYYANNLSEFIRDHDNVQELIISIFENIDNFDYADPNDEDWMVVIPSQYTAKFDGKGPKDWNKFVNKEYFMDPNDPPESISAELIELKTLVVRYVYSKYLSFDRIYRLRNFERYTVTVIDTDSNILSLDTIVNQIFDEVTRGDTYGRDVEHNNFIAVNMIAYILTEAVRDILLFYGENSNIPEEFRPIFNMKNEFYFSRLIIGEKKKRYISKILLREGNLMNPPKSDIKGFDFKKSTTSEFAEKEFMKLINKHILQSDEINLKPILADVYKFRDGIIDSIKAGETTYLPNASVKPQEAYANPDQQQGLIGVVAWNYLNHDTPISLPAKVSMLKLTTFKPSDIEGLHETHPDIYEIIMDKIFDDDTGMFVKKKRESDVVAIVNPKDPKWYENIPKKMRTKWKKLGPEAWNEYAYSYVKPEDAEDYHYEITVKGFQYMAIPQGERIPEWVMPYIDYATVVNNILAPFVPVLKTLGMKTIEEGKVIGTANRKTKAVTNIIKF